MKPKPAAVPKQDENEDQIKLKPFMGMRPGVYLTILYSLIIIAVIFFLLLLPGIRNPVAALIVKTEPAGAAIRVNDVYMGLSGEKIIVPKGEHTITAVMPGFESESAVHQIQGSVFGSLFFPKKYNVEFTLKTSDPAGAFALYAAEYAAWSFGGDPSPAWQVPMSLSEGAYRLGREQLTDNKAKFEQILLAASRFTVTRTGLRDLIRAKILLDGYGNSPSPITLIGSISDALVFLSENAGSAAWLNFLLTGEAASSLESSEWVRKEFFTQTEFTPVSGGALGAPLPVQARLNLSGQYFTGLSGGKLQTRGAGSAFRPSGKNVLINSFYVSENPVSRSLFEEFLEANPEWSEHLTDYEQKEIAVNPIETYGGNVITGVTWYAAGAFCKWLTKRLPSSMAGMEVRLPTEYEWEYAALNIGNMQNPGWEWCLDPFAPLQFINADDGAIQTVGSPERSLRGRPPGNPASSEMRASLPPDLSSPFVTFRAVIAAKR